VVFSQPLATLAENYIKKGTKLCVEGQIQTRKWQTETGEDRYSTEIVLRPYKGSITLLGSKDQGGERPPLAEQHDGTPSNMSSPPPVDDMDDEIPF
jgi:single-strand DNA-binding protein